ncbi:hypothetical protein BU14_2305s0001 [Porphyra umbilicalis]|uniref:Uncharacterized protein n=1 Tax=Porphyra umbilicalis TaxID=2786 RepID=A0A1X6NJE8_PORUM|nr:hypothetical protein BU14_2305s0001 [Porphyra umbilicalis]|eukprot:OSX68744.1 hypothetical protein BU14_2305s0001 [Porphyra umbilicalis]
MRRLVEVCPGLTRVAIASYSQVPVATVALLAGLPRLVELDAAEWLPAWDASDDSEEGDGGDAMDIAVAMERLSAPPPPPSGAPVATAAPPPTTGRPWRRLALPRWVFAGTREDATHTGVLLGPAASVDVARGPCSAAHPRGWLPTLWAALHPGPALAELTLRDVDVDAAAALAAAPVALLGGLTRLTLVGRRVGWWARARWRGSPQAQPPPLHVGCAAALPRLRVLALTRVRLVGGGLPALLGHFWGGAAAAAAAAAAAVAATGPSGAALPASPPHHPLTAVTLTSVGGVYDCDAPAYAADVYPAGGTHPLRALAVVSTVACPSASPSAAAADAPRPPPLPPSVIRRRLAASYPTAAWPTTDGPGPLYPPPPAYNGW